jgi:phosphate transport system protein
MAHYEERLQKDLDKIHAQAAALASDAEKAITNALQAVQTGNTKLAYTTILEDSRINRAHRELNKQCYRFIALHLPSAGPLRFIEALVRANIQYERLGDYAVTICREAIQMSKPPEGVLLRELELISSHALRMLNQAIAAFNESNEDKARTTMSMGADVEQTLDVVYSDMTAEADRQGITDLLAMFVVFNMVKRVTDQAKNICEEALFAISGEYKADKHYSILFVDEDGSCLAPMAEAVARKMFPDSADFASASRTPGAGFDPAMQAFMDNHGFDMATIKTGQLDTDSKNISNYYVVVSLQGPVQSYIGHIPFHTAALEWDVGSPPAGAEGGEAGSRMEELYREIVVHVRDLLETVTGKEAA